eukprot:COSAG05_NODE_13261_length_436_cov_0.919881_1_plen_59_part_00
MEFALKMLSLHFEQLRDPNDPWQGCSQQLAGPERDGGRTVRRGKLERAMECTKAMCAL